MVLTVSTSEYITLIFPSLLLFQLPLGRADSRGQSTSIGALDSTLTFGSISSQYNRNITLLLTAPPYILAVVCILVNGRWSDMTQLRYQHIAAPLLITMVANIIAVSTLATSARYIAVSDFSFCRRLCPPCLPHPTPQMMLMPASFYSSAIVTLSW